MVAIARKDRASFEILPTGTFQTYIVGSRENENCFYQDMMLGKKIDNNIAIIFVPLNQGDH